MIERAKKSEAIKGDLPSAISPPSGCRFRTRCPLARERCAEQEPLPRLFGDGHLAACHFPLQPALPGEPAVVASGSQACPGSKSPGS